MVFNIQLPAFVSLSQAKGQGQAIFYELAISFDIHTQQLNGTAHLKIPPGREISLFLDGIVPTGVMLKNVSDSPAAFSPDQMDHITIRPAPVAQELFLSFKKQVDDHHDNFITNEGIALISDWFPSPSEDVLFSLSASIPKGFVALTESDTLPEKAAGTAQFSFSRPTTNIHFIAAPFIVSSREVRENLTVYTYFLPEDQHLADGYLDSARNFILRYEEMIGEFPYNHFVIAENLRPTGYGMPTFTLLGKYVIRLPFIKDTSLGHEILHSWFGNSVAVDYSKGNWSEGLTSYLADWLYREDDGEAVLNRKEQLLKYHSYVTEESAIPLNSFFSANHNQPMAGAVRSVGYIKGAMLFHELRTRVGDEKFFQAMSNFYHNYRHKRAGWSNIQKIFEEISEEDLDNFFSERLQSTDTADLQIKDIDISTTATGTLLNFTVTQQSKNPFQLALPIRVESTNWSASFLKKISEASEQISLPLKSLPNKLIIDPDYDLMRTLDITERVPILAHFLGPRKPLVVAETNAMERYSPYLDFAKKYSWPFKSAEEITGNEISAENLVLLGEDNRIGLSLFGPLRHPSSGMTIETRSHPLNEDNYVLQISASSDVELRKALPKLRHYGKYSYLHFQDGRIVEKRFSAEPLGYAISLAAPPRALPAREVLSFDDTLSALLPARVIYLGESHTAMQDHHLQYLVIEKLFQENQDIAIGMEMFPASTQAVLDEYVRADTDMDEKAFLKRSRYFQVWKYDYRYYKKIIDFAKKHEIPLIGLNIEREVVSSINRNGSTDMLSEEQKKLLPRERDLSLPGYSGRLKAVYNLHAHGGGGRKGAGGFIQAQGVWDEVMAKNIADYLSSNPHKKIVVIAGSEHARKDNGIPPRVMRRLNVPQTVVMTIDDNRVPSHNLADFFFYIAAQELPPSGKIGISLEEKEKAGEAFLEIIALSEESNAGKSGLLPGDIIATINDFPVTSMEDIHIALAGKQAGESITMKVRRGSATKPLEKKLTITLYDPASPRPR